MANDLSQDQITEIVGKCQSLSGAEVSLVCREAGMNALRQCGDLSQQVEITVTAANFESAVSYTKSRGVTSLFK